MKSLYGFAVILFYMSTAMAEPQRLHWKGVGQIKHVQFYNTEKSLNEIIVGSQEGILSSLDPGSGEVLWRDFPTNRSSIEEVRIKEDFAVLFANNRSLFEIFNLSQKELLLSVYQNKSIFLDMAFMNSSVHKNLIAVLEKSRLWTGSLFDNKKSQLNLTLTAEKGETFDFIHYSEIYRSLFLVLNSTSEVIVRELGGHRPDVKFAFNPDTDTLQKTPEGFSIIYRKIKKRPRVLYHHILFNSSQQFSFNQEHDRGFKMKFSQYLTLLQGNKYYNIIIDNVILNIILLFYIT